MANNGARTATGPAPGSESAADAPTATNPSHSPTYSTPHNGLTSPPPKVGNFTEQPWGNFGERPHRRLRWGASRVRHETWCSLRRPTRSRSDGGERAVGRAGRGVGADRGGRNSGNSSVPPSSGDLPGRSKPQPKPVKGVVVAVQAHVVIARQPLRRPPAHHRAAGGRASVAEQSASMRSAGRQPSTLCWRVFARPSHPSSCWLKSAGDTNDRPGKKDVSG